MRSTVGLALLCMVAMFAVQTAILLHQQHTVLDSLSDEIASTNLPLLSVGLWDIELQAVQQQVAAIAERPQVGYVLLTASTGQKFEAGNLQLRGAPGSHHILVPSPQGGGTVGELVFVGNRQFILDELLRTGVAVLAGYGLFTLLICGLIAYLLRRKLQIPLQQIAQFASQLTPQTLTQPLDLARPPRLRMDEIDLVADGFSTLQQGLRAHIANLDHLVAERTRQLEALAEANHQLSITDALTGCFNRRVLASRLFDELERARRYGRPISVICLDLDHFKKVNDRHGHLAGDTVLCTAADRLRSALRSHVDWVVRLGGEEFLIVLPETNLEAALLNAERLRQLLEGESVAFEGHLIPITASFGVAQCQPDEDATALLVRADDLLYQAKAAGRNRVYPPVGGSTVWL